ncbi:hypothetical protein FisN_11Lh301 [Fistulifera solaris]|uniref:Uncharacterized protein n=1 Tax=Fistulifera solaris TaxID=1519565 RepID=A0A1Z5K0M0_FISSO|nr:hypothetical protein FisN_11Lh301 [Fistulifera solaris]|eukprot:GAX19830.1 hypothetical protein FisN_11Lh301 [Fistulifera solaris]
MYEKTKADDWVFTPDQVREIAAQHDYQEISLNVTSRVISFRQQTTRINVYYTTGTVSTCLNHPVKGKTQLFRRNIVTTELLDALFDNPRKHTGEGYFYTRKQASQEWKWIGSSKKKKPNMTDMARRWEYVATAANLVEDDKQLLRLTKTMNQISHLFWDAGTLPSLEEMNYACGSLTGVGLMVQNVAREYGTVGLCHLKQVRNYITQNDGRPPQFIEFECLNDCENVLPFMEAHARTLHEIERSLKALPLILRKEVCQWLLGLKKCGTVLVDKDYHYHFSEQVVEMHEEYSQLYYAKKHLAKVCPVHGVVMFEKEDHDSE